MTLSPAQIPATPVRILIVEDEGLVADELADLLLDNGYQVVGVAESSEGALEMVPQLMPELILMDIRIKGSMDGIATAAKLREHFDIPIIYLTASSDPQTVDRAKITGAFGYVTKPVFPVSPNSLIHGQSQVHARRYCRRLRDGFGRSSQLLGRLRSYDRTMKEKLLWPAIALGLVLVLGQAQTPAPRVGQPTPVAYGRFQIYSLNYSSLSGNTVLHDTDVFRIDTVTGETSMYLSYTIDGKSTLRWCKIAEP